VRVIDVFGNEHVQERAPARVVSLVPSITETLFDLGAGSSVVGITDFCIFPEEHVKGLVRVGGTKNPAVDRIRELEPDLVHMNLEENLERHAAQISDFSPVFVSEPKTVHDVAQLIRDLGEVHDRRDAARDHIAGLEAELSKFSSAARFTFACPVWKEPWMWCGGDTYVSSLIAAVGGGNVLSQLDRYPRLALDQVVALAPDVIFLPNEPMVFTEKDRDRIQSLAPSSKVIGPFPGHLITWHGTRTIAGLRFLRERLV